jgi:hypothetical protein
MPTVYIASRNSISSGISSGPRVYNPCGDGYGPSTLTMQTQFDDGSFKNVSFIVCSEAPKRADNDLELGLGLGLGLGIPFLALLIYVLWWKPRRNLYPQFNVEVAPAERRFVDNGHINRDAPDRNKILFNKLGHHLHRQFLAGNLTQELKIMLKSFPIEDLNMMEALAFDIGKTEIVQYISQEILHKNSSIPVNITVPNS